MLKRDLASFLLVFQKGRITYTPPAPLNHKNSAALTRERGGESCHRHSFYSHFIHFIYVELQYLPVSETAISSSTKCFCSFKSTKSVVDTSSNTTSFQKLFLIQMFLFSKLFWSKITTKLKGLKYFMVLVCSKALLIYAKILCNKPF